MVLKTAYSIFVFDVLDTIDENDRIKSGMGPFTVVLVEKFDCSNSRHLLVTLTVNQRFQS